MVFVNCSVVIDFDLVIAAKGTFGLNIIPRNTPLDIFFELNPIIGLSPCFDGLRYGAAFCVNLT